MLNNQKSDIYYLEKLSQKIEEKLDWGSISKWTERNFQELSDLIDQNVKYKISVTTLKRIMGRLEKKKAPHLKTLNNLAHFMGYENWTHYKMTVEGNDEAFDFFKNQPENYSLAESRSPFKTGQAATEPEFAEALPEKKRRAWQTILMIAAIAVVSSGLGYWVALSSQSEPENGSGSFDAISKKDNNKGSQPLGGENVMRLTHENFNYEKSRFDIGVEYYLPDIDINNVNLIRFDGNLRYLSIDNESRQGIASHTYTKSGLYPVKIFSGKQTMAHLTVVVPTKDWVGEVFFEKNREQVHTFNPRQKNEVAELKDRLSRTHGRFWVKYKNFENFPVKAANFVLKTRFRNIPTNNETRDGNSFVEVLGDKNKIRIQVTNLNSQGRYYQVFSEQKHETSSGPLAFKVNLSEWQTLMIEDRNKSLTIKLGDSIVHQTTYEQPLGYIKGFIFSFAGLGEVDYLRIYSLQDELMYEEEF